ncbi:MAG: hypothetical protein IPO62_16610, partial [Saprospiraceae bacterium]|nr:hypothetical protein [Saprospiraceae bacterium]
MELPRLISFVSNVIFFGQDVISDPYLLIAAMSINSNSTTSADITEIRKLILGSISRFSKVPSWTFVPWGKIMSLQILLNLSNTRPMDLFKLDDPDMTLTPFSIKLEMLPTKYLSQCKPKVSAELPYAFIEFDDLILQADNLTPFLFDPTTSTLKSEVMHYTLRFDTTSTPILSTKGLAFGY